MNTGAPADVIRSWQDAEIFAAQHMVQLGFDDAEVTSAGADGGIDVRSRGAIAQVKHFSNSPVGGPVVQQLIGASSKKTVGIFYALTGYTAAAVRLGTDFGVALFSYSVTRDVEAWSPKAHELLAYGFVPWATDFESEARNEFLADLQRYGQRVADAANVITEFVPSASDLDARHFPTENLPLILRYLKSLSQLQSELNGRHDRVLTEVLADIFRMEGLLFRVADLLGVGYDDVVARAKEWRGQRS